MLEASVAGSCLFGKLAFSVLRKRMESLTSSGKNVL